MTEQKPYRVLVLEDNPADAELLRRALWKTRLSFDMICTTRLADALSALERQPIDVVLADLTVPDAHGTDVVIRLRESVAEAPIVVLTSLDSDEAALDTLTQGAQDYLTKDSLTPAVLEKAIRYAMQRQRNVEMQRLLEKVRASEKLLSRKNRRLAHLYRTAHRFVDNVSHEFRTPLTVIIDYVSLLRDGVVGTDETERTRVLDVVADRADDLNNMVHDMLNVSKLSAGILGMMRTNCRIAQIAHHIWPNLQKKAAMKGVALTADLPENLPEVFCDPEKIGRVLVNLAVNAIKFSGEPGTVGVWATYQPGAADVVIGVTDNGPGIDKRGMAKIFKRFKQLGTDARGSTKGVGLGLNIAKELVDLNFGEMSVDSAPGQGSTFSFTVPVNDPQEISRRYLSALHGHTDELAVIVARSPTAEVGQADDLDSFLHFLLRRRDLLLRPATAEWLLLLPSDPDGLKRFIERADEVWHETNRNRPFGPLAELRYDVLGIFPLEEKKAIRAVIHEVTRPPHSMAT